MNEDNFDVEYRENVLNFFASAFASVQKDPNNKIMSFRPAIDLTKLYFRNKKIDDGVVEQTILTQLEMSFKDLLDDINGGGNVYLNVDNVRAEANNILESNVFPTTRGSLDRAA